MLITNSFVYSSAIISAFAFIGGGFKYIDQAYDAGVFSKKVAWIIACCVGVVMGVVMGVDSYSAELLLAIVIGVTFMSKFDNWPFRIMGLIALLLPGILGTILSDFCLLKVQWLSLGILTCAAVLDEYLDTFSNQKKFQIFEYRPILEIVTLLAVIVGFLPLQTYLSLLAFDLAYNAVKVISNKLVKPTFQSAT
ncbi:hypothetical protein [Nostoc sp. NMS4]|uniref:hypothetical protein n=1 Tax=Nostoc sp. NMS4 TaxID=2815390 RepID=UPI0025F6BEBA|nr:hypothetical protein [Nostoc sp. NMS4]MBN3927308.1 hypothetical protein [Nostoc sp. NMS4]